MKITPLRSIIYFLVSYFSIVPYLHAEELRVSLGHSYEDKVLQIPEGINGQMEVSLKSSGRPLDGYLIGLIRRKDSRILMSISSDENGIVRFSNVPPDHYLIKVLRIPEKGIEDFVSVGDVVLGYYGEAENKPDSEESKESSNSENEEQDSAKDDQ